MRALLDPQERAKLIVLALHAAGVKVGCTMMASRATRVTMVQVGLLLL
jgi:hypothetical protein